MSKKQTAPDITAQSVAGLLAVQRQRSNSETLQQHYEMLMADKQAAVQASQDEVALAYC